ncbi:MAG: hypothetical protein ACTS5I_08310 [Rhodanobacter sp.]
MVTDADIDEIKRMCVLLYLELQDVRRVIADPSSERVGATGVRAIEEQLKGLEGKMQALGHQYPHYLP